MKKLAKHIIKRLISQDKKWERLHHRQINSSIEAIFDFPEYTYGLVEQFLNPKGKNYLGYAHPEFLNYGHAKSILDYAGTTLETGKLIGGEHGLRCLYPVKETEHFDWYENCSIVLTQSLKRKSILQNAGIHAEAIGPFIHYAKDYSLSKNENLINERYGQIHVAFPYRSLFGKRLDAHGYIRHLLANKDIIQYDTLLVSGRKSDYAEIENDNIVFFSSGGINNPFFLSHLRFIFNYASTTSSNVLSASMGYSIYLKKTHFVYGNDTADLDVIINDYESVTSYLAKINPDSHDVANTWGFNCVKPKKELGLILRQSCS